MFVTAIGRPDSSLELKDLSQVALAAAALVLSLVALIVSARKSKRDAFLGIHDKLTALDIQEGRKILFNKVNSPEDAAELMKAENSDEYDKVNRAMAMYDVLGFYVYRRFVRKSWF